MTQCLSSSPALQVITDDEALNRIDKLEKKVEELARRIIELEIHLGPHQKGKMT